MKGNGCRNRIVKEDRIMEEIEKTMGTVEDRETLEKVQKVLVYEDHVKVVMA